MPVKNLQETSKTFLMTFRIFFQIDPPTSFRSVFFLTSSVQSRSPPFVIAGDSPPGLSKEIASALSHVPGFEMDPFSLDDPLRMDHLALDMLEGDLMLADPAVEDSFRSDRLK